MFHKNSPVTGSVTSDITRHLSGPECPHLENEVGQSDAGVWCGQSAHTGWVKPRFAGLSHGDGGKFPCVEAPEAHTRVFERWRLSELEELPEAPGGAITHLPPQKAEAVFGLPPACLHVSQLKYRPSAHCLVGAASPWNLIFSVEESPLHEKKQPQKSKSHFLRPPC